MSPLAHLPSFDLAKHRGKKAGVARGAGTTQPVHRVALVEDRRQVREQWAAILNAFGDFACVQASASGEEALETIPPLRPDIVLMDIFFARDVGD